MDNTTTNVQGWISVKERLPEPGTQVWAWQHKYATAITFIRETPYGPMWKESVTSVYYGRVTHWQPLPVPPTEGIVVSEGLIDNQ